MCSSRYAAAPSSCERASSAESSSTPCSRSASGSAMPSRSVSERSSSWSRIEPAAADEPKGDGRLTLGREAPDDLDAREHVQAAVEPAAVRDRVHVAAEHEDAV